MKKNVGTVTEPEHFHQMKPKIEAQNCRGSVVVETALEVLWSSIFSLDAHWSKEAIVPFSW